MPAYAGYAGYASISVVQGNLAAAYTTRAGIHTWILRVQYDAQFSLPCDYTSTTDGDTTGSIPSGFGDGRADSWEYRFARIRHCHRAGANAEAQIVGHWDQGDDPFRLPYVWSDQRAGAGGAGGQAFAYHTCELTLAPVEGGAVPQFFARGVVIGLEVTAQVRALVSFQARIAVTEILEYQT